MIVRTSSSVARLKTHTCASVARVILRIAPHLLLASVATAADGDTGRDLPTGGHANGTFIPAWDADGDGKVPRAEYDAVRAQRFVITDANGDGVLSVDEYANEYAARLDQDIAAERKSSLEQTHTRFRAIDKDSDGFIARAEYDASGDRAFAALDHDKDGRVAKTDPEAQRPASACPRSVIGMPTTHSREGLLDIYDEDGDGVVTREQYDAQRAMAFASTDANRDGKLDEREYLDEFTGRLDRQAADNRQAQLKQSHVRFKAIDDDKNGGISREEYSALSARTFERADTNADGTVSKDDPAPPREARGGRSTDREATESKPVSGAKQLQKIKVTAAEAPRSTVGNAVVVDAQQLEDEQAQNFEDAIRYIPGVSIVDMGRFGENGFNIRGLESDRVALTVDGLALAETVETTPAYEFFRAGRGNLDIDSLKAIEVVKGADSITAGSGALGGAVLFTTKDPYDYLNADGNDTYFRIKTAYTSSTDEGMTTATLANRTGIVESMLLYTLRRGHEAESWYDSTPVQTGSERRTPDPIDRDSDGVLAKVDLVLNDSHRVGLVAERARENNDIDNLSRVGGPGYLERRAADDKDRDRYGVRYLWQDAATLFDTLEWTADRQETKSRALTTILAGTGCPQNVVPCLRSEDRSTEQVLDRTALDFTKALRGGVSQSLVYGVAWQRRNVDFRAVDTRYIGTTPATDSVTVDPAQVPKTDVSNLSVYLRDSVYLLNDRLTLHAGARYDRTKYAPKLDALFVDNSGTVRDVEFSLPTWQAGAEFEFIEHHSVWAQVGRGFRAPLVGEMYAPTTTALATEVASGNEVTLWSSVANPSLEAEKSFNTELGYRWRSDRHELGIAVFRDEYTNFVETTTFVRNPDTAYQTCVRGVCTVTYGNTYTTPANFGEVTVEGVEVEGRVQITQAWSARLAWSYSEGEKKNGDPLPSIVPATGVLGVRYVAPTQRWSVNGNVTHADAKKLEDATISETTDFFAALVPDYLSDEYTVFDLFGNVNITENIQLTAGIYNVFDERYYLWPRVRFVQEGTTTPYGYVTGDGIGRYSEPGRNFRVSLAWQF